MKDISATIRIQATVEITVASWNGSASFNDIREQATREGLAKLHNALKDHQGVVVGQPKALLAVIREEP